MENLTIQKARILLDQKEISAVELAKFFLAKIEKENPKLNAYLQVYDNVLTEAAKADALLVSGQAMPLTGIPLAVKDNILIQGQVASSASKILQNYLASYDATVITKLKAVGAVFLGRANMDEFACGGSTENSAYGVTKNPHDLERVAGGSSGGSAAAVAAELAIAALGSDTGGSVREPASFCGVVGLKPTYGRVSRYGLMAMGSSLDCIGPLSKTVTDSEIIFDAIKGYDSKDSTTLPDATEPPNQNSQIKIGVPYHLIEQDGIDQVVKENLKDSIKKIESLGFAIRDIRLPNIDKALAVYYIVMPAEVSSNLARFDGIRYGQRESGTNLLEVYQKSRGMGLGAEVRRRIILGTYVLSSGYYDAYYGQAMAARQVLRQEFAEAFEQVDAILTPTVPSPAFKIGEKSDPLSMYLADIFTVTANIVGVPAISLPSGSVELGASKLPLGIQLMGNYAREDVLFNIGKKFLGE